MFYFCSMPIPPSFDAVATVHELAAIGMRVARAVARLVEIETEAAEVVAADLPARGLRPAGLAEARDAGLALDMAETVLAKAGPRAAELALAFDRVSRSVRRAVALGKRLEAGWPVRETADTRAAMIRRQVAQGVTNAIRHAATGEAAERLFDELAEMLEEPALDAEIATMPVDVIVARIRRDLGLAEDVVGDLGVVRAVDSG